MSKLKQIFSLLFLIALWSFANISYGAGTFLVVSKELLPTELVQGRMAVALYSVTNIDTVDISGVKAVTFRSNGQPTNNFFELPAAHADSCSILMPIQRNHVCIIKLGIVGALQNGIFQACDIDFNSFCNNPDSANRLHVVLLQNDSSLPLLELPSNNITVQAGKRTSIVVRNPVGRIANNVLIQLPQNILDQLDPAMPPTYVGCDSVNLNGCIIHLYPKKTVTRVTGTAILVAANMKTTPITIQVVP